MRFAYNPELLVVNNPGRLPRGYPGSPDPFGHQLRVARQTLRMSDAGARIMGGMTKDEARIVIEHHRRRKSKRRRARNQGPEAWLHSKPLEMPPEFADPAALRTTVPMHIGPEAWLHPGSAGEFHSSRRPPVRRKAKRKVTRKKRRKTTMARKTVRYRGRRLTWRGLSRLKGLTMRKKLAIWRKAKVKGSTRRRRKGRKRRGRRKARRTRGRRRARNRRGRRRKHRRFRRRR